MVEDAPTSKEDMKSLGDKLYEERLERRKQKRSMSPHVISRIYRAPEVVLMEPTYSFAVDVWALGCVIAELL